MVGRRICPAIVAIVLALTGVAEAENTGQSQLCRALKVDLAKGKYAAANYRMNAPGLSLAATPCAIDVTDLHAALHPTVVADPLQEGRARLSGAGRYEFIGNVGVAAMYDGVLLMIIADADGAAPYLLVPAGLGAGAMYLAARWTAGFGMERGTAAAIRSGGWLGTGEAVLGINAFATKMTGTQIAGTLFASQLIGTGLGVLSAEILRPSDGQVAMVNSGAFWGALGSVVGRIAFDIKGTDRQIFTAMFIGMNVGGIGAALASSAWPMTRGRMAIIDAGGLLGGVMGMGSVLLVTGSTNHAQATAAAGIIGTVGGMIGAGILTQPDAIVARTTTKTGLNWTGPGLTLLAPPSAGAPPVVGARLLGGTW